MIEYSEALRIGIDGILAHKLRAMLTALGVVFGVAAVVSMLSIGEGARREAIAQIRLLGTNNIRIRAAQRTGEQAAQIEASPSRGLTYGDGLMIAAGLPNVLGASPIKFIDAEVVLGKRRSSGRVIGTDQDYDQITSFRPSEGRFVSAPDVRDAKRVCVIGTEVRRQLFGFGNPINRRIRIEDDWFTVVGVMEPRTVRESKVPILKLRDINQDIYVPITTALKRFTDADHPEAVDEIAVRVKSEDQVLETADVLKRMIRRTHYGAPDCDIVIPAELLAQSQRTQRLFNIVMGSIAAISLLVGGIGIMNIMLANVTERTREIGIRRSVGATEKEILVQFLHETVLVSGVGGLTGIVLGATMAKGINLFAGWETVVSLSSVMVAFGVSVMVGIVFGIYPARQAARLDPVEALRYE
jgi:putative ABC transport system permease protein